MFKPSLGNWIVVEKIEVSVGPPLAFLRGDSNRDNVLNISDPINTLGFLFQGNPAVLKCQDAADANDDGKVDFSDALFTLTYLFNTNPATPAIPPPFPAAGADPTPDSLGCNL